MLVIMKTKLKQGTFRWRRRFRHMPTLEILKKELPVDWLAMRVYNAIWRYIYGPLPHKVELVRVREFEFQYIIHQDTYGVAIEIIQKEPKNDVELY